MSITVQRPPERTTDPSAQPGRDRVRSGLRVVGWGIARVVGALLAAVLAIPVLLLPLLRTVPRWLCALFAVADLALLVALFRLEPRPLAVVAALAGIVGVSMIATLVSQAYAFTPPIRDSAGALVAGSIATMETVRLGNSTQWITIRGRNAAHPVLLFLAGGPGGSELSFVRNVLGGLEDHFVVVNWDQPGAGKSYRAVPRSELTVDRVVSDGHDLVLQLRQRFHQDKIHLMGESWGTVLGVKLVQRCPELFHAYVGAGQRTSVHEDDVMGYEFAIDVATEGGNTALAAKLRRNGPPPYSGSNLALKYLAYVNVLNSYAFEHTPGRERTGHDLMTDAVKGTEYGLLDKVNWFRGLLDGFTVVYPQLEAVDFATQAPTLDVPVYFLQGRYDMLEIGSLLERWFAVLRAPRKEIIYFEQSGHTPHSFEPGKVVDVLAHRVLPQTAVAGLPAVTPGDRSDGERRDDR